MASISGSAIIRAAMRRVTSRSGPSAVLPSGKRCFASSTRPSDDTYEAEKWEKITYSGIATCTVLAFYDLTKGHPHFEEPLPYPYLHIRKKDFPWGPDSLFETIKKKKEAAPAAHSDH